MSVVDTMSLLLDRDLKKDELFQATVLGWLTELLQAYLLVADDIMDESYTRRGNPCWCVDRRSLTHMDDTDTSAGIACRKWV